MRRTVVQVVRSDSFAGVERYICDVSGELARRGWEVAVIGGDARLMLRALPPRVQHTSAVSTAAVARALVAHGPAAVVHAHMTAAELASVATRRVTSARVIATRHFAAPRGRSQGGRVLAGLVTRGIDREIAISRFVADAIGGAQRVILNGVPHAPCTRSPMSRTVLVMQRLQQEKDTATAVRGFAASGLAADGWLLRIAGRGPEDGALRELSRELGVGAAVDLVGFVSEPARLRAETAVFLAPAPSEPFGLSVAEAMAAGLPVIAADGGAHREVLGEAGLLFAPGDWQACAEGLRRLAGSAAERDRLGDLARARQQECLSLSGHVDQLERVYEEVLR